MNAIECVQGDLFALMPYASPYLTIIPHVVNDIGGWGRGFVVSLGKVFPVAEKAYRKWAENKFDLLAGPETHFQLGNTQLVLVKSGGILQKVMTKEQNKSGKWRSALNTKAGRFTLPICLRNTARSHIKGKVLVV